MQALPSVSDYWITDEEIQALSHVKRPRKSVTSESVTWEWLDTNKFIDPGVYSISGHIVNIKTTSNKYIGPKCFKFLLT